MHARYSVPLLFVGSLVSGCDSPEGFEDVGDAARAGTYAVDDERTQQTQALYFAARPSCPTYMCGLNSPFIGHELNLDGVENDALVRFVEAHHPYYGPVKLEMEGDELVAHTAFGEERGADLVGLTLELEGLVEGEAVPLSVKLIEASWVSMWAVGSVGNPPVAPAVPSYKFVYSSPGIENQLLCPSPTEGAPEDTDEVMLAKIQAELFDEGAIADLWALNEGLQEGGHAYDSVLFAGERFDFDTAEIYAHGETRWFNWGCRGSSAAKLHLTGHTEAASMRLGVAKPPIDLEQTMLYAYTATYCPGAPQMTVPGHPIRISEVRGVLPRDSDVSFHPQASGSVEALWGPSGVVCLSTPRLATDNLPVWSDIISACPAIPACPDRETTIAADVGGNLLNDTVSIMTLNLAEDSCSGRCGTAGSTWDCTPTCAASGTCGSDFDEVCP